MGADEFHERDLAAEIQRDHQAIVSARDLEPDTLAVQDLGLRRCSLNSTIELQWAALTSVYQRSNATRASGCLSQNSTSVFRAITLIPGFYHVPNLGTSALQEGHGRMRLAARFAARNSNLSSVVALRSRTPGPPPFSSMKLDRTAQTVAPSCGLAAKLPLST